MKKMFNKQTKNILIFIIIIVVAYLFLKNQKSKSNSKFGGYTADQLRALVAAMFPLYKIIETPPPLQKNETQLRGGPPVIIINNNDICEVFATTNALGKFYFGKYMLDLDIYSNEIYKWTNIYTTSDLTTSNNNFSSTIAYNNRPISIGYMKYGQSTMFYFKYQHKYYSSFYEYWYSSRDPPTYRFISFDYKNSYRSQLPNRPPNSTVKIISKKIYVNITDPLIFNSLGEINYNVIQANADIYLDLRLEYTDTSGVVTYASENVKITSTP